MLAIPILNGKTAQGGSNFARSHEPKHQKRGGIHSSISPWDSYGAVLPPPLAVQSPNGTCDNERTLSCYCPWERHNRRDLLWVRFRRQNQKTLCGATTIMQTTTTTTTTQPIRIPIPIRIMEAHISTATKMVEVLAAAIATTAALQAASQIFGKTETTTMAALRATTAETPVKKVATRCNLLPIAMVHPRQVVVQRPLRFWLRMAIPKWSGPISVFWALVYVRGFSF